MYTPNRMSSYVTRPPCCCSAFSNTKTITPFCQCCTFPIFHLFYWKIESILILELSSIRYNHLICHTMLTFMNFYFWRSRSPFIEYVHVTTSMGSRYEMLIFCIEIHLLFKTICSFCWFLSFNTESLLQPFALIRANDSRFYGDFSPILFLLLFIG